MSKTAYTALEADQKEIITATAELLPLAVPTIEYIGGGSVRCMIAEIFTARKMKIKQSPPLKFIGCFGFACGFLYGVGGFIHDYILTGINHGSYLALNALWGMPLIFGGIGLMMGLLLSFLRFVIKR